MPTWTNKGLGASVTLEARPTDVGRLAAPGEGFYDLVVQRRESHFGVLYAAPHASTLVWIGAPLDRDLSLQGLGAFWQLTSSVIDQKTYNTRQYASAAADVRIGVLVKGPQEASRRYDLADIKEQKTYIDGLQTTLEIATFLRADMYFAGNLFASVTAQPPSPRPQITQPQRQMTIQLRGLQTWTAQIVQWAIGRHAESWDNLDVDSVVEALQGAVATQGKVLKRLKRKNNRSRMIGT